MPSGYVMTSETSFTAAIGESFTGADIGLSGYPNGYFEVIGTTAPGAVTEANQPYASFCLGLTCVPATGAAWIGGTQTVWVIFQQQETVPGTPFGDGQWYNSVGIGSAEPSSTPYAHRTTPWDTQEFSFSINFGGFDVLGTAVDVICRQYEFDPGPFAAYDLLPGESGNPGDPGYLAAPSNLVATENESDKSLLTLEWDHTPNPAVPDGFAIFDIASPSFPSPIALVGADARSYAFLDAVDRDVNQQFLVTAFNATKHSDSTSVFLDAIVVELAPASGIMSPGSVHNTYLLRLEASNGLSDDATFTYAVTSGALPDGLTLIAASGIIVGVPTLQGDYNFEVVASSTGVADSAANSYNINILLSVPWTASPPPNQEVKPGETLTITPPDGDFIIVGSNLTKASPLPGPAFEFPYPPTGPCLDCLTADCAGDCGCIDACTEDVTSAACQECMQTCIDCLTECLESLMDAEDCNETLPPGAIVTVYGGKQFQGTVPLGSWPILEADASGLYKFVFGQTYDIVYTPARDGNIYHVKIPNPGGTTAFFED